MYLVWESAEGFQVVTHFVRATDDLCHVCAGISPHSEALLPDYIIMAVENRFWGLICHLKHMAISGNRQPDRFIYQCLENIYERE